MKKDLQKEKHNTNAMIENKIWEIAKILNPDSYLDYKKISSAKENLLQILQE